MTGIGHLSSAFLIKSKFKNIPIWQLLIGSEIVELFWVILNWNPLSIEPPLEFMKVNLPFAYIGDMRLLNQPYSHSLLGGVIIGIFLFLVFKAFRFVTWKEYLGFALVVSSHFLLDYLVHDHDLQIFPSESAEKIGPFLSLDPTNPSLGVSTVAPLLGLAFQVVFSLLCFAVFLKQFRFDDTKDRKKFFWVILSLHLFSIPIFLKGVMTFFIRSEMAMVLIVLLDMLFAGVMLYYFSKKAKAATA